MSYTVVDHRNPVRHEVTEVRWQAIWDGNSAWFGSALLYRSEYEAFPLVVQDYCHDRHKWTVDTDPAEDAPDVIFSWAKPSGAWKLYEDGEETGVWLRRLDVAEVRR